MSIINPLKNRIINIFNQAEAVAAETELVAKHLRDTTHQLAEIHQYQTDAENEHAKILIGATNIEANIMQLSQELELLVVGLRDVHQLQHLMGRFLSDVVVRFQVLVTKWEESGELTQDVRDDISKLATLLVNFEVFLNDPDELAALLSAVDSMTLDIAMQKVKERNAGDR